MLDFPVCSLPKPSIRADLMPGAASHKRSKNHLDLSLGEYGFQGPYLDLLILILDIEEAVICTGESFSTLPCLTFSICKIGIVVMPAILHVVHSNAR